MNREQLEDMLYNEQDNIVGVSINDYFYNVDYILDYNIEFNNEPVLCAYEITSNNGEFGHIEITEFTMNDLLAQDKLEFYRHTKI